MSKVMNALTRAEQERDYRLVAPANDPHRDATNGSTHSTTGAAVESRTTPETVEQAIAVIQDKLSQMERDTARQAGERLRMQAQLTASEGLLAQLEQERKAFQQRLAQMDQAAAELEAAKTTWVKQLSALRECQVLSHELQMAEQSVQAHRILIEHTTQAQQRMAAELADQTQQQMRLQQRVEQLKFQLGHALALTGTTKTVRTA